MTSATAPLDTALQHLVDDGTLPGVSYALLRGGRCVAERCFGLADREADGGAGRPMAPDTIVRAYSNTKLVTSVAALRLVDAGLLGLDDPVATWIPAFADLRVLRPDATHLTHSDPSTVPLTLRQLFTHTAGFAQGIFDAGTLLQRAYMALGVRSADTTLAQLAAVFAELPLGFPPGSAWHYSAATDMLARVVEVASGLRFGDQLQTDVFAPLGMVDTTHVLRPDQHARFAALYGVPEGAAADDPRPPASRRLENSPYPGAFVEAKARQGGAGGLVTTQRDWVALLAALRPGAQLADGRPLLKPATLAELLRDQLPPALHVQFPPGAHFGGPMPMFGFSLAGAVTRHASPITPAGSEGVVQWGGLAGTHWWIDPARDTAGVLMTQRLMGYWQPWWWQVQPLMFAALA